MQSVRGFPPPFSGDKAKVSSLSVPVWRNLQAAMQSRDSRGVLSAAVWNRSTRRWEQEYQTLGTGVPGVGNRSTDAVVMYDTRSFRLPCAADRDCGKR